MIGAIMGIGGALMGALNANSASNQSWQRQHQLMEIKAELNRKNAKFNTAQAKEMWNYTNFENQMKHIREAGLSPGLIYGMGGQGGSTQGAGAANGVGLPQARGCQKACIQKRRNKRIIPNEKRWKTQSTNLLQKQIIYRRRT